MSSQQYVDQTPSGLLGDADNTKIHSGHVSTGSQLVSEGQQFTGVDMAAETAKFDNAFGAVKGHQEFGSSTGTTGASTGSGLTGQHSSGLTGQQSSGFTGEHSSGLTGQHSSGLTGQHSSGLTGEHSSGLTGQHSSGLTDQHSSGLTGEHSSGLTGQHSSGLTGTTSGSSGAYQGQTEHQHSSHGHSHHHGSSGNTGSDSYTGSKEQQREQMKEEKKENAQEKKDELSRRNEHGESKSQIAKDEYNKASHQADKETPDGHKPSLMEKVKTAVKNL